MMFALKAAEPKTKAGATSTRSLIQKESRSVDEQEAAPSILTAREAASRVFWDLGKIPLFSPDPADPGQTASSRVAKTPRGDTQAKPGVDPKSFIPASPPAQRSHKRADREEDGPTELQPEAAASGPIPDAPPIVHQVLRAPGQPLQDSSRRMMESRLSHDFTAVRVHCDSQAGASARSIGALAYAVGSHIVFGDGLYQPATPAGRMLLAHELAHVVQQSRGSASMIDGVGTLESAADRVAASVARAPYGVIPVDGRTGLGLFRQPKTPEIAATGKVSAMTPEDMYTKMLAMRGFDESIPAGQLEDVKNRLKQMESDLKASPNPELQRQYNKLLSQYNISTDLAAGGPAGAGYNTYAIVQVVGPDGKIIAVAEGKYTGGLHAEQIALKNLEAQLGDRLIPGTRIDVVSDKVVCPGTCVPAFQDFAEKYDVGKVDAHVFRRPSLTGPGLASEKTTARTITKKSSAGMSPVKQSQTIVSRPSSSGSTAPPTSGGSHGAAEEHFGGEGQAKGGSQLERGRAGTRAQAGADVGEVNPLPRSVGTEADVAPPVARGKKGDIETTPRALATDAEEAEADTGTPRVGGALRESEATESMMGGVAKSALKGAAVSIGTGVALSILQDMFRDKVLNDLAALPKPQADRRTAHDYFTDPKTRSGVHALDVLSKNLGQFSKDLEDEQARISGSRFLQLMATAVLPEKTTDQYEKKLQDLDSIQGDLDAWEQELLTIDSNLDALLELEGQLNQMAQSARDLRNIFSRVGPAEELLKIGFSYEEYIELMGLLDGISSEVEVTLRDAHKAKETVRNLLNQTADFDHRVNRIWWDEFGGQVGQLIKDREAARRQAQQRSMQTTKAKYGSLEGFEPLAFWNSDQLGMWYGYKTRESEILFQLNELTKGAANSREEFDRKVDLEAELAALRQKMLQMRGGVGAGAGAT